MKSVKDLVPNPDNPRKISDEKLKMLEKSLSEFGDLSGVIFNLKTKKLVGGHQRLKVIPKDCKIVLSKKYSKPTKLGTVAEGHIIYNTEKIPYREVRWNETREKAANIAANKHTGEWDVPILTEWLKDLNKVNYDIELIGFNPNELQKLIGSEDEKNQKKIEDETKNLILIELKDESETQKLYEELVERGYECKLMD